MHCEGFEKEISLAKLLLLLKPRSGERAASCSSRCGGIRQTGIIFKQKKLIEKGRPTNPLKKGYGDPQTKSGMIGCVNLPLKMPHIGLRGQKFKVGRLAL
jgi:hypothetical protein